MRLNRLAAIGVNLLSIAALSPAVAQTTNLEQIYALAQDRDASIATANASYAAGQEKASQGRALLGPSLTAGASYTYSHSKDDLMMPDGKSSNTQSVSLNLTQPLYNSAAFAGYRQGKLAAVQAKDNLTIAEQDLIVRTAQAYFNVLSAQESVRVAQAQKRAFSENLERAKLTFKVGTATITDKHEAQARYDLAVADEIAANSTLEVAKQSLASIIGEMPAELADLKADTALPELTPADMAEWIKRAKTNNAQLKAVQQTVAISQEDLNKARAGHKPVVSLVASAGQQEGYNSFLKQDNTTDTYSVAVQLQVPIFASGMTSSQVREANALRESAKSRLEQTERNIVLQTQQAYLAVANGRLRVLALQAALLSNQSAMDATKKGLEVGIRTNLDLLNAQQLYFATQRDLAVAKYNYLIDILRLKSASGSLEAVDLNEINALLQG
ncbi:MAG: TolC family outer membrane protein [Gammaproteobacteria bacterium]|nr:TolC family outer membrane protein [Gammaproteobacteria bacterium]